MKENHEIQDKIDRFLLNQMNSDEKKNFESHMDNNPGLKKTVDAQKLIVEEIKERESFMAILEEAENSAKLESNKSASSIKEEKISNNKHKTFQLNYKWTLSIAAAIIGIAFIIWQPHKSSNQDIFNTYTLAYASSNILESDNTIKTRGGNIFFENLNPTDNSKISEALNLYYNKEYGAAKAIFEQVLVPKEKNNELVLYMAICQLFSSDINNAINNLTYLSSLKNYVFKDQVNYYLALAYIKNNQISKARTVLSNIQKSDSEYATTAAEMLNKMRWF